MALLFVYIPCPSEKAAIKLSKSLLKEKLIACSNIHKTRSLYNWNKKQVDKSEFVVLAKTVPNKFSKIKSFVKKLHPYSVPCISSFKGDANKEYVDWVSKEVNK